MRAEDAGATPRTCQKRADTRVRPYERLAPARPSPEGAKHNSLGRSPHCHTQAILSTDYADGRRLKNKKICENLRNPRINKARSAQVLINAGLNMQVSLGF